MYLIKEIGKSLLFGAIIVAPFMLHVWGLL